jgi:hypothetical protein
LNISADLEIWNKTVFSRKFSERDDKINSQFYYEFLPLHAQKGFFQLLFKIEIETKNLLILLPTLLRCGAAT